VSEVAHEAHPDAIDLEGEQRVLAPFRAALLVVRSLDGRELDPLGRTSPGLISTRSAWSSTGP
jgi:hypothetical protein